MRAGDSDNSSARNGQSKRLCSSGDRNSELTRASELGMSPGHRRRDDQLARTLDVVGAMSLGDADSERLQIVRRARIGVAARHRNSTPSEQLGERAHSGAGDPDEMNRALVGAIR